MQETKELNKYHLSEDSCPYIPTYSLSHVCPRNGLMYA